MCGPGPVVLGGAGAEEMGCMRTDRWQSHLLTALHCGAGRGREGREGEGRRRMEEGEGGGRKEGVKAVRLGDRGWGGAALARAPLRIERTQIHDGGENIHATPHCSSDEAEKASFSV